MRSTSVRASEKVRGRIWFWAFAKIQNRFSFGQLLACLLLFEAKLPLRAVEILPQVFQMLLLKSQAVFEDVLFLFEVAP